MIVNDPLPINQYSRSGRIRPETKAIILHYVGNPGTSAKFNRDYWAGLANQSSAVAGARAASAHFVVGLEGEIVRAVPQDEIAFHCGSSVMDPASGQVYTDWARTVIGEKWCTATTSPNQVTIGIELCHPGPDGKFLPITEARAAFLAASLCLLYRVDPMVGLGRHWDVVGWKSCPLYFVTNPLEWDRFKRRVAAYMEVLS